MMATPRKRPGAELLADTEMHLLSPEQVSAMLCISRPVLRSWARQGFGPAPIRVRGHIIGYFRSDVYAFIRTEAEKARLEHEAAHAAWLGELPEAELNDETEVS